MFVLAEKSRVDLSCVISNTAENSKCALVNKLNDATTFCLKVFFFYGRSVPCTANGENKYVKYVPR